MAFEFKLPDLGEGIAEGEIVKWHVKPGDRVEEHQVVLEIETDKAIVEVPSPKKGTVKSLARNEGEVVNVGETLLVIALEGESVEAPEAAPPEAAPTEAARPEAVEEEAAPAKGKGLPEKVPAAPRPTPPPQAPAKAEKRESVSVVGEVPSAEVALAPPRVRKVARELGVDLGKISGTGPGGVITEEDVRKTVEAPAAPAEAAPEVEAPPERPRPEARAVPAAEEVRLETGIGTDRYGPVERIPIKGVRRTIARNLMASQEKTAFVTGMDEADVTELWDLRKREKDVAAERGVHLTFLPFFMKAVRHALELHPMLNGSVDDSGEFITVKKYFNIGVAVDTPDGLMVAVVREVDRKTILDLAEELQELSRKAVERKITLEELKGSTFTISNYGSFGGTFATPIINPPDIAILGTGRITDKPWVVKGEIAVRKVLPLSLTFDHRVVDGVEAARFLTRVIRYLEDPAQIFIESA